MYKDRKDNYSDNAVNQRLDWLSNTTNLDFKYLNNGGLNFNNLRGNIENPIGFAQIPIGLVGPLKVNGDHINEEVYIPMATTEGTLVDSYNRGIRVLTQSGGVNTKITKHTVHITPYFYMKDMQMAFEAMQWLEHNFQQIKEVVAQHTKHGVLDSIEPKLLGKRLFLKFSYNTADAMGLNMVCILTNHAINYIAQFIDHESYFLRSNYSADKKVSFSNHEAGYGREVYVDAVIPYKIMRRYLGITPQQLADYWKDTLIASNFSGTLGHNGHFANGLAATFIACGQDPAQVVNSSLGQISVDLTAEGDAYCALRLPSILVGTVGGGTGLATQRECLEIMGCYGAGKSNRLAEIISALLLAGELSITAGVIRGDFISAHTQKNHIVKQQIEVSNG